MKSLTESTSKQPIGQALPAIHQWVERLRAWRLRREASLRLMALSDTHLKDIGLHRSEIKSRLIELEFRQRDQRQSSLARRD